MRETTAKVDIPADKGDYCRKAPFFPYKFPINETSFPFEDFVDHVMTDCTDAHWRPQHTWMNKANWRLINFLGKHENVMADTHTLLKQIGAFEEFGASGWGEFHNESIFQLNNAKHKTGSRNTMDLHYTPKVRKDVFQYVRGDYETKLFNFTIPSDLENL